MVDGRNLDSKTLKKTDNLDISSKLQALRLSPGHVKSPIHVKSRRRSLNLPALATLILSQGIQCRECPSKMAPYALLEAMLNDLHF